MTCERTLIHAQSTLWIAPQNLQFTLWNFGWLWFLPLVFWIDGFSQSGYCMPHSLSLIKNRTDLFSGFWERHVYKYFRHAIQHNLRKSVTPPTGGSSYVNPRIFIDTIPRLLYTKPTSKSQTNNSYDYEKFIIVIILNNVSVCRSKTWYMVTDIISKFSAGSAGDSILMNNSMHKNFNLNYYS